MLAASLALSTVFLAGPTASADEPPSDPVAIDQLGALVADNGGDVGVSGEQAVELLDQTGTTEIAADNAGMEPAALVEELLDDPSMFVTGDADVGYVDAAPTGDLAGDVTPSVATLSAPAGVDVFNLNSRPTSQRVIYLDIDGHTTVGDYWNTDRGISSMVSVPYVSPATMTAAQRDEIYEIWQRVSEDYLPFDVNVTTRDPGTDGLRKTWASDQAYGQRMVISPTQWYAAGTLGIALLNVFDDSFDHSAFVFTSSQSTPRAIAEAVSHEAGHTFGLRHDGLTTGADYYDGHGDWAPIMGRSVSPRALVTQWSRGEYANANNREDDVLEIASVPGVGFSSDDHPSNSPFATLVGSNSTTSGEIGAGGDVDVFAVDAGPGPVTVNVRPTFAAGSNLDAKVTLRDPAGNPVSGVPSAASDWVSTATFNAPVQGRYTIEVTGIGWLTPFTGFSSYGSMGAYQLQVSDNAPTPPLPPPPPALSATSLFTSLNPDRLLDTRTGEGGSIRIPAGGQIALQVTGRAGVPVGATAAVLSVVAVDPSGSGYLTTFNCTPTRPTASTVNFVPGQIVANTTIATLTASGQVCIYAHATTDVLVDVTGYLSQSSGARFTAVGPTRVMDTRSGFGGSTRLRAGDKVGLDVSGLPAGTTAVALNVTSDGASGPGFATVFPCASGLPRTSTVNFVAGDTRPNNTIVGVAGGVCIYAMTSTDIIVDLVGYFGPNGLSYLPTSPTRLLDTRDTVGYLSPEAAVSYRPAVASLGSYSAVAAAVNVTAVDHVAPGYVTTYGCGPRGTTSTVNAVVGQINANGALVPLRDGLDSCLFTQSGGNLVVDLSGWWVR